MQHIFVLGALIFIISEHKYVKGIRNLTEFKMKLCMLNAISEICIGENNYLKSLSSYPVKRNRLQNLPSYPAERNQLENKQTLKLTRPKATTYVLTQKLTTSHEDYEDKPCGYKGKLKPPQKLIINWMYIENGIWNGTVDLEFEPPKNRKKITQYLIEYAEIDTEYWDKAGDVPDFKDETMLVRLNLIFFNRNEKFKFRVTSKNSWKEKYKCVGEPSNIAFPSKPSCPENANITDIDTTDKRVTLVWQEPDDMGSSVIIQYIIEYKKRDTQYEWKLAKTVDGESYESEVRLEENVNGQMFKVVAVNVAGRSEDCPFDYLDFPDIPRNISFLHVNKEIGSVQMKWRPPSDCGNRDCIAYLIFAWPVDYVIYDLNLVGVDVPPYLMHQKYVKNEEMHWETNFVYYTLYASSMKMVAPNQTKADPEKLKIDFKTGLRYAIYINARNGFNLLNGNKKILKNY